MECVLVEHSLGLGGLGHVEGDVVAVLINGLQIHGPVDQPGQGQSSVHRQEGVVAEHGHAQLGGDVGHLHADGPQADDAQHLARQLRAHKLALALLHRLLHVRPGGGLLLHPGHAVADLSGGQQQSAHRQLLHRIGVGAGGIEYHDARLGAAVDGDVISARARPGHGPQGIGECIVVHVRRADQNTVLVFHIGADGVAGLVQYGQPGGGNLIQCLDAIHIALSPSLFLSNARMKLHAFHGSP